MPHFRAAPRAHGTAPARNTGAGDCRVVTANPARGEIFITNPAAPSEAPKAFTYDQTYGPVVLQQDVYATTAAPIIGASPWPRRRV